MGKINLKTWCSILLIGILFSSCNKQKKEQTIVFVASSMSPVIYSLDSNENLQINTASSGVLARQIEAGAKADLFISANRKWVQYLVKKQIIDSLNIRIIAKDELVAIIPANANIELDITTGITKAQTIVMGNAKFVPVGEYAQYYLENSGLNTMVETKLIETKDALSVLKLVEIMEADIGITYHAIARKSEKVQVAYHLPDSLYPPVNFYASALSKKGVELMSNTSFNKDLEKQLLKHGFKIQ